jgi:hypothetical protein
MSSPTRFLVEPNSSSLDPSWLALGLPRPWFFLTPTQGLDPPLDSDSISIRTCFLNLLLEFIQTTYPGNLYPIGLPNLTRSAYLNHARTAYLNSIWVSYPIASMLTRPYTFISSWITLLDSSPDRTSTYTALHGLTWPNYLTRFFSQSDFYLPGLTRSYPAELPRCTQLLTQPYPITLPGQVPIN